jgi:predicted DNA-binding protein
MFVHLSNPFGSATPEGVAFPSVFTPTTERNDMSTQVNLPIELYDVLERHLGHDDSRAVAKVIEQSIERIESRSIDVAEQRKREIMEQMRNELVTKDHLHHELEVVRKDMEVVRKDIKADLLQLDKRFSLYFAVMMFAILFVNKDAITLLAQLLGLIRP